MPHSEFGRRGSKFEPAVNCDRTSNSYKMEQTCQEKFPTRAYSWRRADCYVEGEVLLGISLGYGQTRRPHVTQLINVDTTVEPSL